MRAYVFAFAAMVLATFSTASFAQPVEAGPQNPPVVRGDGEGHCEELRKACLNKGELGEKGEGNCAHYREVCKH